MVPEIYTQVTVPTDKRGVALKHAHQHMHIYIHLEMLPKPKLNLYTYNLKGQHMIKDPKGYLALYQKRFIHVFSALLHSECFNLITYALQ